MKFALAAFSMRRKGTNDKCGCRSSNRVYLSMLFRSNTTDSRLSESLNENRPEVFSSILQTKFRFLQLSNVSHTYWLEQ